MTPESRTNELHIIENVFSDGKRQIPWLIVKLLIQEIRWLRDENVALRRGQGTAPEARGPGTTAFHETNPIPDSTKGH